MGYSITQIEDAIIAELQESVALSSLCKTITSYHGEIDDLVSQASQLIVPLPAVYAIYAGSIYEETANRSYDDEMSFTIVAIAKDLRGDEKLRAAMYPILEEIMTILMDNDLGMDIEPIHPVRIEPTLITKLFSVYSIDIKTSFTR
ncbi:MAG: DUF1834 family protein [Candidatus Brocadia sp.]|nr:DUF1834 family protein [Candidatus Brocadia sp.]